MKVQLREPVQDTPDSIFLAINGEMVRDAALKTKGSGGPSDVDANGFKRILACISFKNSSKALCEALATLTRTMCTEYVDPSSLEALVASRLIPPWIKVEVQLDPSELEKWYVELSANVS